MLIERLNFFLLLICIYIIMYSNNQIPLEFILTLKIIYSQTNIFFVSSAISIVAICLIHE